MIFRFQLIPLLKRPSSLEHLPNVLALLHPRGHLIRGFIYVWLCLDGCSNSSMGMMFEFSSPFFLSDKEETTAAISRGILHMPSSLLCNFLIHAEFDHFSNRHLFLLLDFP